MYAREASSGIVEIWLRLCLLMRSVRGGGSSEISPRVKFHWLDGRQARTNPHVTSWPLIFRGRNHFYCLSRVVSRSLPSACPRSRSCTLRAGRPVRMLVQFGLIGGGLRAHDEQGRFGLLAPHHWNSGRMSHTHIGFLPSLEVRQAPHGGDGCLSHCLLR